MTKFGIGIKDGSSVLSQYAVECNTTSLQLYDWQRRAINFFFKNDCNVVYEVTTGAGKTFCAIEIMKQVWKIDKNINVLIVVPKNVILETGWYKELYENAISLKDIGVYYGDVKEYAKFR